MSIDKIQLEALDIESLGVGVGQATDTILYRDNTTGELKRSTIGDLQTSPQGEVYTVNGMQGNVTLSAADVGARPSTYVPAWGEVTGKPTTFTPSAHTHAQSEITGLTTALAGKVDTTRTVNSKPLSADITLTPADVGAAPDAHQHVWANLSDPPTTATRWPTWTEVTSKPTTFTPATHNHPWTDLSGIPAFASRWPAFSEITSPPAYTTRWPTWTEVTDKPTTFAPSTHGHSWAQITSIPETASRWPAWGEVTSKPTVFTPDTHAHNWGDISGAPVYTTRWPTQGELGIPSNYTPNSATHLSTSDLNSITTPGFYYQDADANTSAARNYPQSTAGSLIVVKGAGITQIYTTYSAAGGRTHTRGFYNGVWSAWKRLYDTVTPPTAAEVGALPLTGGTLSGALIVNHTVEAVRGVFFGGTGNDFGNGSLEVLGNGAANTVYPNIGFHQPGLYASSLQLRGSADFRFIAQGGASYANVTAATFYGALAGNATTATTAYAAPWTGITDKPSTFTPTAHSHGGNDVNTLATYLSVDGVGSIRANNTNARSAGMYGIYESGKYGHIWSIGTTYRIADNGTSLGNLYGLAYVPDSFGAYGLGDQMVWAQNGAPRCALGTNIWTSGNVTAYSDIRVKTNIEKIDNALDKVCQLSGYTFDRTDTTEVKRQTGVIAQELVKVLPEAVTGGPTEDNPDALYSVAYGNIVGLLIEAIKELKAEVEELRHGTAK